MTRRRALLLAVAALCLGAAALLALLAHDVGARQASLRSGGVTATEIVPFGAARRLLAVDDDIALRRAVAAFRRAHTGIPSFELSVEGTALRVRAETALARELRVDRSPQRASVASNLLGVLAYVDSTSTDPGAPPVDRSVFEFQDAIRLDPRNDEAKANLELAYQEQTLANTFRGNARQTPSSRSGASAASQGHGY